LANNRIPFDRGCGVGAFNDQRGWTWPLHTGNYCDIGALKGDLYLICRLSGNEAEQMNA